MATGHNTNYICTVGHLKPTTSCLDVAHHNVTAFLPPSLWLWFPAKVLRPIIPINLQELEYGKPKALTRCHDIAD